jgi:hypothetical protein
LFQPEDTEKVELLLSIGAEEFARSHPDTF